MNGRITKNTTNMICKVISLRQLPQRALYVETTSKFSLEQRHDLISTTFQRCSNVRCPLGRDATHAIGRGFAARQGRTKDHRKIVQTSSLITQAIG